MPTFAPSKDSRCSMEEDVKALVKVAVKKEQRTSPVIIHRTPNKRAKKDLGTLSPYLCKKWLMETDELKAGHNLIQYFPALILGWVNTTTIKGIKLMNAQSLVKK